jgi:oligoendopeptidase F
MGPEYVQFLRNGLAQRWVDRGDNIGKSSGAFCATPYGVHPFVLTTWADTMRNTFVLTHELGHGAHFSLAMKHQRFANTRPACPSWNRRRSCMRCCWRGTSWAAAAMRACAAR